MITDWIASERRELAVMIIDLERFKRVNDTLGRYAGDQVLKEMAGRLRRTISESATPARIGSPSVTPVTPINPPMPWTMKSYPGHSA